MYMSDEQIIRDYRQNPSKLDAIHRLAGVNKVSLTEMREYLFDLGEKLPRHRGKPIDKSGFMAKYRAGMNDKQMAAEFGCCEYTVYNWRIKNGLPSNYIGNRLDKQKALELYKQGYTDYQIAKELCLNTASVRYWRTKNGLTRNKKQENNS